MLEQEEKVKLFISVVLNPSYPLELLEIKKKIIRDFFSWVKVVSGLYLFFTSPQVILMCSQGWEALVFSNFFIFLMGILGLRGVVLKIILCLQHTVVPTYPWRI